MTLSDARCASAVYSRPGEAYLFLANLDQSARKVTCMPHPDKLPWPLTHPAAARRIVAAAARAGSPGKQTAPDLNVSQLVGKGLTIEIPGDGAVLVQIRSR
ncbi:MAG: hypothetical protein ACC655_07840 [Rhodothermia bacterium]